MNCGGEIASARQISRAHPLDQSGRGIVGNEMARELGRDMRRGRGRQGQIVQHSARLRFAAFTIAFAHDRARAGFVDAGPEHEGADLDIILGRHRAQAADAPAGQGVELLRQAAEIGNPAAAEVELLQSGHERPAGAAGEDLHLPIEQGVPDCVVVGRIGALLRLQPVLPHVRRALERRGEHARRNLGERGEIAWRVSNGGHRFSRNFYHEARFPANAAQVPGEAEGLGRGGDGVPLGRADAGNRC